MTAGTKVVLIDDPSRVGEATGRTQQRGPFTYVEVRFGQEVKPVRAEFLREASSHDLSAEERIRAGQWGKADDLRRLLTFEKLKGCLHDFLYSMDAARIEFHEYQFKPVLKFINSPTERLLIADEVGLGKTIEAALIWLEMQARHDARRLLVVCPNMRKSGDRSCATNLPCRRKSAQRTICWHRYAICGVVRTPEVLHGSAHIRV